MIKLIIYDWDDVFTLGSKEGYYKCYHEALKGVGVRFDPKETDRRVKAKWGSGHSVQLQFLLKEHPEKVHEALEIYQKHFFGNTFVDCLSVVPGSQKFLIELSKKYKLAIATGSHPKILKGRLFKKFDIPDVFASIITIYDIDDISHAKPHPYIPNKIMNQLEMKPDEAVLVGDAASDMQMAWNAGIEPIAVLTGHMNHAEAEKLGVKYIFKDVTKLMTVLNILNSAAQTD